MQYEFVSKDFYNCCRQEFRFLVKEFGFASKPEIDSYLPRETWVCFTNRRTNCAVQIAYYAPAGLFVALVELQRGQTRESARAPKRLEVDTLLTARAPEAAPRPDTAQMLAEGKDPVKSAVSYYATAIRNYAADILRGDFSEFDDLWRRER